MRDLERLLTGAYPEGLRDVPPAPVRKSAVRDKTFEKLGLERPERQPLPHEQWSQAKPRGKAPPPLGHGGRLPGRGGFGGRGPVGTALGGCPGPGAKRPPPRGHLFGVLGDGSRL